MSTYSGENGKRIGTINAEKGSLAAGLETAQERKDILRKIKKKEEKIFSINKFLRKKHPDKQKAESEKNLQEAERELTELQNSLGGHEAKQAEPEEYINNSVERENSVENRALKVKKEIFEYAGNKDLKELAKLISGVEQILDSEKEDGKGKLKDNIQEIKKSEFGDKKFTDDFIVYLPADGEAIFIGDTHGDPDAAVSIIEQEKFIEAMEKGEENKYLVFLGDYVDRGKGDIENIEQIIALYKKYPDNVVLLRGNHEGKETTDKDFIISLLKKYGNNELIETLGNYEILKGGEKSFRLDRDFVEKLYSTDNEVKKLDEKYNELFEKLPGVVVCGNGIIGVHGGIPSRDVKSLRELNDKDLLFQMRWNDPSKFLSTDREMNHRGSKQLSEFSEKAFNRFMDAMGGKIMVRAHEETGDFEKREQCIEFKNKLVTIFSTGKSEKGGYSDDAMYAKFDLNKEIDKITVGDIKKVDYIKPNYNPDLEMPDMIKSNEKEPIESKKIAYMKPIFIKSQDGRNVIFGAGNEYIAEENEVFLEDLSEEEQKEIFKKADKISKRNLQQKSISKKPSAKSNNAEDKKMKNEVMKERSVKNSEREEPAQEFHYDEREEKLSPAQEAMRKDSERQEDRIRNMEKATGTRFDLDRETAEKIHTNLKEEIDQRTLELVKNRLAKQADATGEEYLQELDGEFALNKAKELGWLDEEKENDKALQKLYNLRTDLLGTDAEDKDSAKQKYNTLLSGESRLLILEVFNEKAEKLKNEGRIDKANELFALREKITEQIIGKNLLAKISKESPELNPSEEEKEEKVKSLIEDTILKRRADFNSDYRYDTSEREYKYGIPAKDGENNTKNFIAEHIGKFEKIPAPIFKEKNDLPHFLDCAYKMGYDVKEKKKYRIFGEKQVILAKDKENINFNALNGESLAEKFNQIIESAHKEWSKELAPEAKEKFENELKQKVKNKKEAIMGDLAGDNKYLDKYYQQLENRLLEERVFRKLKEKNPEQMEKLAKIFGGKGVKIKDMILDIGKIEFDDEELDSENNLNAIIEWEANYGMPASEKKAISGYNEKLPPNRKFKSAKKGKSGIIQWLLGFELSKSKSSKR